MTRIQVWYCGHCDHGPHTSTIDKSCVNCGRREDEYTQFATSLESPLLATRRVVEKPLAGDLEPPRRPQVQQPTYQTTSVAPDVSIVNNSTNRSYEGVDGAMYKQASQYEQESNVHIEDVHFEDVHSEDVHSEDVHSEDVHSEDVHFEDSHSEDKKNDDSDFPSTASPPSMFSRTALFSVPSADGNSNVVVQLLVPLLLNDRGLQPLFGKAPEQFEPDKFERNFSELLKAYAYELDSIATGELQKEAIRLVYSRRRYVANCIRSVYVPDTSDTGEKFRQLIAQNPAKDQQLEKFFHDMNLVPKAADPDNGQSSGDCEMEDPKQPNLPNLTQVRNFLISREPFENLRKNFYRFINPHLNDRARPIMVEKSDTVRSSSRAEGRIEESSNEDVGSFEVPSTSIDELVSDAINGPNRSRSIRFRNHWNMWHRPSLRAGYRRLEWICDCGEELYGDFDNANPEAVNRLHHILQRPAHQSTEHPNQPQPISLGTPLATSMNQGLSNPAVNAMLNTSLQPNQSTIPRGCNMPPPPEPYIRKFVELCVNTGKFHKSLGEIDITHVNCDRDLFALTKSRYDEVRGHRSRFFLLEPTAVEWVQFSLEERHRVGILLRPKAVPPEAEVLSKHYEYAPCPLDALPPIPDNVFLHHFANPGPHRRPIWLHRLPKKVNDSILGSSEELVTGWGVHIIEGPNWPAVWKVAFCIVSTSGLFGILWSVYRSDVSGAFGVASWMTSVLTLLMMVFFTTWSRE